MDKYGIKDIVIIAEKRGFSHEQIANICGTKFPSTVSRWKTTNKCHHRFKTTLKKFLGLIEKPGDNLTDSEKNLLFHFAELAEKALQCGYELSIRKIKS